MAIQKISIIELLALSAQHPVFDVRSPGEFLQAHIPGAISLPLFSDEERKIVGTAYKQESRQQAIRYGLDFFGVKMREMAEAVEKHFVLSDKNKAEIKEGDKCNIIIHCWRGGMRSAAVAWLMDFYGFEVYLLEGGYKNYRNWVLSQFDLEYNFSVVGGYTGSGKTQVLTALKAADCAVIDLEEIACHRGSAFGALGKDFQPSQEMFENILAAHLYENSRKFFWLEDESQRIGNLNIPLSFWNAMRGKQLFFLNIPFEERLIFITEAYGTQEKETLIDAILRIKKRLGPLETKTAVGYMLEDNIKECFRILLHYYDKSYLKSLQNRENLNMLMNSIDCHNVDANKNAKKIISCTTVNT